MKTFKLYGSLLLFCALFIILAVIINNHLVYLLMEIVVFLITIWLGIKLIRLKK